MKKTRFTFWAIFLMQIFPFFRCSTPRTRRSRRTVLTPGRTDGINRWWDSGGELFGIVLPCAMRESSVTRSRPTLLPPTRHGCKSLPDTPYKEPNEMREKIIRYEPAGRGILSIKDAFYLAGSTSCLALPLPDPSPPSVPSPPFSWSVWSSTFFTLPPSGRSYLRHPFPLLIRCTWTRHNLLPRITQRLFFSRHALYFMHNEETRRTFLWLVYVACFSY